MEQIARETLPPDFSFDWGGASFQEKRSGGTSILALGLAALMVFLILAAQYEKLVAAAVGAAGAALRHLRRAGARCWLRGLHQRRLLPDRPGDAARPRREERDPDRRVRGDEEARGPVDRGRRGGGGAAALPADPDDLARLHPRRAAARVLDRRRRRRAPFGRHRRDGRHAGGDLPRDLLHPVVLQADRGPQADASRARPPRSRRKRSIIARRRCARRAAPQPSPGRAKETAMRHKLVA